MPSQVSILSAAQVDALAIPLALPLFSESVQAGFPSPAQDYVERTLDLNELCIQRPAATYLVKVQGDSMIEAGIYPGDILVVDRSLHARHGDVVIARVDADLTVKLLQLRPTVALHPCNKAYRPIELADDSELEIMGVVVHAIRNLRKVSSA